MFKFVSDIGKDAVAGWWSDRALSLGAAIAYYTAFSLAPMLLLVIAVAGLVFGRDAAQVAVVGELAKLIGHDGAALVERMIASASDIGSGIIGTLVGLGSFLVIATGALVEIQSALNIIWKAEQPSTMDGLLGFAKSRLLSFALIASIGFLLLVSLMLDAGLAAASNYMLGAFPGARLLWLVVNSALGLAFSVLFFALVFAILPSVRPTWTEIVAGALLSGVLFTFGKFVIGMVIARSGATSAYGASASIMTIMLWVYYSSQILLFGAEFGRACGRWTAADST
ncbi:YihY/virulence factor BrkB family protein [Ciceribacter thiooxidans]|uniref:YihY/virulence factor BrkB family protein n=1 Tax=Ciceribacter thiooxidans TaxID=1969821 RepID=A0ABV7I971_9HYPH|nr:YihY/virulence factor BrkB family protein [Ciceribacter thiooxidans]MDI6838753.1 YihY/virulence factor BrkB family protein [Rhizobiaceae bacterium]